MDPDTAPTPAAGSTAPTEGVIGAKALSPGLAAGSAATIVVAALTGGGSARHGGADGTATDQPGHREGGQ